MNRITECADEYDRIMCIEVQCTSCCDVIAEYDTAEFGRSSFKIEVLIRYIARTHFEDTGHTNIEIHLDPMNPIKVIEGTIRIQT